MHLVDQGVPLLHLHSMKMPCLRLRMSDHRDLTVISPDRHSLQAGKQPGADERFNIYDQGLPCSRVQGLPELWEPSYKENKDLPRIDAAISSYNEWAQSTLSINKGLKNNPGKINPCGRVKSYARN